MKRRPSIALRLSLSLSAGMALLWIGAAGISVAVMQHGLNLAYDDSLRQSALRLLPLAIHDLKEREQDSEHAINSRARNDDDDEVRDVIPHDATFAYFVRDADGQVALRDEHVPDGIEASRIPDGFGELNGQRTYALADQRSRFSIIIIELSDRRSTALRDSAMALGLPLLALIPLIAGGVWFAMRLALRPLEVLRRDIAQRDSRNLAPLGSDGHPAELAPIAEAVAALLERLKSALDAERAFAARSAHELRTPIAGALAQTQQLAEELANRPGAGRVRAIEAALKRLSRLSDKLLQLARIEAGFARTDREADQLPVLKMVIRDLNADTAWQGRVVLEAGGTDALPAAIDSDAFAMVVRNLIENGLKHGDPETPVRVLLTREAGTVQIRNEGVPLDPDDLVPLGQPFVRGDTPADGSGLGLSIARGILEQAGGKLTLASPIPGSNTGFEATVILPDAPAEPATHDR